MLKLVQYTTIDRMRQPTNLGTSLVRRRENDWEEVTSYSFRPGSGFDALRSRTPLTTRDKPFPYHVPYIDRTERSRSCFEPVSSLLHGKYHEVSCSRKRLNVSTSQFSKCLGNGALIRFPSFSLASRLQGRYDCLLNIRFNLQYVCYERMFYTPTEFDNRV